MGLNIESTKLRLIELIMGINDDRTLVELEKKVNEVAEQLTIVKPDINLAVKSIRSNISLEEIDKEQNYQPVSYKKFRTDADELRIEEPIEDLLATLTK